MRGVAVAGLLLALTTFSGCVEFVDGTQTDLDAAAQEVGDAVADYQQKAGHIAGTVRGADGAPLVAAIVDLVGFNHSALTDPDGGFAFLDLSPAAYSLHVLAEGYLEGQSDVAVTAGEFARPSIQLEPVPPQPYSEVYSLQGYSQIGAGPFGTGTFWCDCGIEVPVYPDFVDLVIEAERHSAPLGGEDLDYWIDNETNNVAWGTEHSPMRLEFTADDIGKTDWLYVGLRPTQGLLDVHLNEWFQGFITLFYVEGAPEGYSAYDA